MKFIARRSALMPLLFTLALLAPGASALSL